MVGQTGARTGAQPAAPPAGRSRIEEPLSRLVGPATARVLDKGLGLRTAGDLLRHYPRRYYERGELSDLGRLTPGELVTVQAEVVSAKGRRLRPKLHKLDVVVTDGRAKLTLTFFNKHWLEAKLPPGTQALFAGKAEVFNGRMQLTNPEVAIGADGESFAGALLPVYPATAALPSWRIAQCVRMLLDTLEPAEAIFDPLPRAVRERRGLPGLAEALEGVHRPETREQVRAAHERLRFDEAFVLQVTLAQRRAAVRSSAAVARPQRSGGLLEAFDARLPFTLTAGQRAVAAELAVDLAAGHPMHRLLQGEVGSGKTVLAVRAMLTVVDAGGQAALLAPTEVLAVQHHRSITALLGPLAEAGRLGAADQATRVALLTGSQSLPARRAALLDAASGAAGLVVGTHALLQEHVSFADLGLVVVDEQHRFGVEQRDALRAKADAPPHVLVMTATPIPRTVAMTVFGDLDVSTLVELPAGRSPISTHVVPAGEKPHFLDRTWSRVREEVAAGHQAYVVCPRIGDGDDEQPDPTQADPERPGGRASLAVLDVAPMLREGPLNGLRVATLHGRLGADAKDEAMRGFAAGDVDVLVSTTVVEVGVDVANATAMVVLDADRFGVSQLHQLRGRVGRGSAPGLCLLVTDAPAGSPQRERLDAVAATLDGFELSRVDLEQRREGDVLGASQSGRRSSLRLLSVLRDEELIQQARAEAVALVDADPDLSGHPDLAAAVASYVDEERADYLERG